MHLQDTHSIHWHCVCVPHTSVFLCLCVYRCKLTIEKVKCLVNIASVCWPTHTHIHLYQQTHTIKAEYADIAHTSLVIYHTRWGICRWFWHLADHSNDRKFTRNAQYLLWWSISIQLHVHITFAKYSTGTARIERKYKSEFSYNGWELLPHSSLRLYTFILIAYEPHREIHHRIDRKSASDSKTNRT